MSDLSDHKAAAARRKEDRAARRKAELMANMARRKAQMRGRALGGGARRVALWQALPAALATGDIVTLEAGCDRTCDTCRIKFDNLLNFQGFPFIPGEDWQISYPNEGAPKDGGSLFR